MMPEHREKIEIQMIVSVLKFNCCDLIFLADADGEQNQRDSASRNPTKSAQLEKDSQQNEELNEVEPTKDNCNSGNERGGDNSVDEEMEENVFDEVEQEKVIFNTLFKL